LEEHAGVVDGVRRFALDGVALPGTEADVAGPGGEEEQQEDPPTAERVDGDLVPVPVLAGFASGAKLAAPPPAPEYNTCRRLHASSKVPRPAAPLRQRKEPAPCCKCS